MPSARPDDRRVDVETATAESLVHAKRELERLCVAVGERFRAADNHIVDVEIDT